MSNTKKQNFRRVMIEDSSDEDTRSGSSSEGENNEDSMVNATDNLGNLSQRVDALNISSRYCGDASVSFEDDRPEEQIEDPSSEPSAESEFEDNDEGLFTEHSNEDYLLDSFCIADSEPEKEEEEEEDSEESSEDDGEQHAGCLGLTGSDSVFEAEPLTPSRIQPQRHCKAKFTPVRQLAKAPTSLETSNSAHDQLMKELYPELYENGKLTVDLGCEDSGDDEKRHNNSWLTVDDCSSVEPLTSLDSDDDSDSLSKYLDKLRLESEKSRPGSRDYSDDDDFIVGDDSDLSIQGSDDDEEDDFLFSADELSDDEEEESDGDKENNEWAKERKRAREELKKKKKAAKVSDEEQFLIGLSEAYDEQKYGRRHSEAAEFVGKKLKKSTRDKLCSKLFGIFNEKVFDGMLPSDMVISWNPRMLTSAGFTRSRRRVNTTTRHVWIELAPKVCTTADRTRDTLLHELCHAAVFLVDQDFKDKHGPLFKKWAALCHHTFKSLPFVTRCHNYTIEKKFTYVCSGCGQTIRRHSKSLDVTKKSCGICHGRFVLQSNSDKPSRAPTKFALYVKEHYGPLKKRGYRHGYIMKMLSEQFKALKINDGEAVSSLDNNEKEDSYAKEEPAAPLPAASSTVPRHAAEDDIIPID